MRTVYAAPTTGVSMRQLAPVLLAACTIASTPTGDDTGDTTDGTGTPHTGDSGVASDRPDWFDTDTPHTGAFDTSWPEADSDPDCAHLQDLLETVFDEEDAYCHLLVRLDYVSRLPVGYAGICGDASPTTAAQGLEVLGAFDQADTGEGAEDLAHVGAQATPETWAYFDPPADFGGAGIVSARTGQVLWRGSIVWDGTGHHVFPPLWGFASQLGARCPSSTAVTPAADAIDFRDGSLLSDTVRDAVLATLDQTVALDALATHGTLAPATVHLYPRTIGEFQPSEAEWIIVLTSHRPQAASAP